MRRLLVATLFVFATCGQPALAWDSDEFDPGPADPPSDPDPEPFVVPEGLYEVTDVYAGDVVTTNGSTTTYSTSTVRDTPGTYARVIDTVGTGASSAYDGAAFNGRASTTAGQAVAGTYYEDYVLTSSGYVAVNIVFFQDDSETKLSSSPRPEPSAAPIVEPSRPPFVPVPTAGPELPVPTREPVIDRQSPLPTPRIGSAGIALGPAAPTLGRIEVLRGRRILLWPRAFVGGTPVVVRSWRLVAGAVAGSCAGSGTAASCDATWLSLAPVGMVWSLRFEVTTDALPGQTLSASIDVVVRSPALEQ